MTLAFVFPGQGSQAVGMLRELAAECDAVKETFDAASSVVGVDLWRLAQDGPEEQLNQTQITQPAMLAAGVAVWRAWRQRGGADGACMAGHSLGEYTALVCADAIDYSTAVGLVADRARFMQQAVPAGAGAMAAIIGLTDDAVQELCAQAAGGEVLEPVNYNAPGQVVIAGTAGAIERAVVQAKAAGAKRAIPLAVSVPAHSRLMQPAADRLAARLAQTAIRAPRIPVLHNVHAETENDVEELRALLTRQVASPVRWVQTISAIAGRGVTHIVELGPGKVLTGLNKRIVENVTCLAVHDAASLDAALAAVSSSSAKG